MQGLMLHGGAKAATLDALRLTPTPEATKTHTPIPHAEMVDTVVKMAKLEGLTVLDSSFGVQDGKDKETGAVMPAARMFGLLTIGLPNAPQNRDYAVMLGLRNSHDKAFAWGLVLGSSVFVCDNLCFSGEIAISRKHTGGIRDAVIPALMQGFARLPEIEAGQALRLERYKVLGMETSYANDYFVRAIAAGVLAPNRILATVDAYNNPKHDEFKPRNLWSAFNAITEVQKGVERVEDGVTRRVGAVNLFELPATGRALHAVTDWYAREMLGDTQTPKPDADTMAALMKSPTRAQAFAN